MPFKQVFERRVNDEMQEGEAGPAPRSTSPTPSHPDSDVKKQPHSPKAKSIYEAEDLDLSSKGEKTLPPRFSTLFDTTRAAPPPPPTPRIVECCHRESKKRAGIYLSTPVFILLVVVLLFESTLLFAYTVIGLYHNLPSGLLAFTGASSPVDGCRCETEDRQGTINFAPNFIFGDKGGSLLDQLSAVESATLSPTSASATSLSTMSGTTTPSSASPSISIVTSTPGVVHSTIIVTSLAEPSTTESEARSTVTSVQIVDGPATTIQARSPTSVSTTEAALATTGTTASAAEEGGDDSDGANDGDTDEDGVESEGDVGSASGPKQTAGPCFGGSGAVMLNCI